MKSIYKTFLEMDVNFRDESNELSFIIIGYNNATVPMLNHPLIMRSNASLTRAPATVP
jgi:hypothetical protein